MLKKKYTVRNRRPSYAFLMEMLWVCGFFAIAACIFVTAFVKADSMSSRAADLNQAVMAAENEMEQTFLMEKEGSWTVAFDESWNILAPQKASAPYSMLRVNSEPEGNLLNVTIDAVVMEPHEEIIYTLEGSVMTEGENSEPDGNGGRS